MNTMNVDDELRLACWVRSEDPGGIFVVKISKTEIAFHLQKAIKNKKSATFHDVDADALKLYKPTAFGSRPYKDNLSKLTLSDHAEFLDDGSCKLSEIFPEQPPEGNIHVIVDAPSRIVCWLRGATLDKSFRLPIRPGEDIADLIPRIKDVKSDLRNVDNDQIRLYRISGDENKLQESINEPGGGKPIQGALKDSFLDVPVLDLLRAVIEVAAIGGNSPTLVHQEPIGHPDAFREYEHIFLKVSNWGRFEYSDIGKNQIVKVQTAMTPEFATTFEQKLGIKPHFSPDAQMPTVYGVKNYFKDWIAEGRSQEEIRYAKPTEVAHTVYIMQHDWQESWEPQGPYKCPLKGLADSLFFHVLVHSAKKEMSTVLKDKSWPINVLVKCESDNELCKYCPRSDLSVSNTTLPRLLVEVNSTLQTSWPMDLVRMLTTGAFIVRFANNFVSSFRQKMNFVLCAFFIWDDGRIVRHTLFQDQTQDKDKVYYTEYAFYLNTSAGRAQFIRYLYALPGAGFDEEQKQAEKGEIHKLHSEIGFNKLRSMHTRLPTGPNSSGRKRVRTDVIEDDGRGGGDGNGLAQLRAHGYEVKPDVIVDASGGEWESLSKSPDHILTVYRPTDSNKEMIVKKVRKESNELEIFRLLDTITPKSDHVISLIDSFDGWLILPKMVTIQEYLDFRDTKVFERKVSQVCLGVIKGVAYLHEHHIAHRDIKLDNLVVDKNFNLKIIDFDIAMRVEDDEEEVGDQCGTRGWMALEVEKGLRHSPIKADRWACGRVILFLLDEFGKEDESLRAFAEDLVSHDPNQRPSLLEWDRYSAPLLSDAGNPNARKVLGLRRERGVNGDGTATPPRCEEAET